jgi:hypothetical protein
MVVPIVEIKSIVATVFRSDTWFELVPIIGVYGWFGKLSAKP